MAGPWCCHRRLGNRLMDPHRWAVASCETDLKLRFSDNIISRLDSSSRVTFSDDLLCCAAVVLLGFMGRTVK